MFSVARGFATALTPLGSVVNMSFLDWTLYQNPLRTWLIAAGVSAAVYVVLLAARRLVLRNLRVVSRRTHNPLDDAVSDALTHTRYFFLLFVAVYAGSRVLVLAPAAQVAARVVGILVITLQAALWGNALIGAYVSRRAQDQLDADPGAATTVRLLGFLVRLALWSVLLLLSLDNLGIDVTALIAGLGIGGVAVALALQNILGDVFASLSIMLDRPFVPGDFIVVGDSMGTVERTGVKTTRVRALSGEQLIFSNADLLASRIRNFKRMYERRVLFTVGVVYHTSLDQLKAIPGIIRNIISSQEHTRFDRCHFKGYGAYSIDIETVYFVLDADYNYYMDVQQEINLAIFRRFAEEGIEFAYPTQTVLLHGLAAG